MNILIPMAGAGSRFFKEGFKTIKPLIKVGGRTCIDWSVSTLGIDGNFIFVVQEKHMSELEPELRRIKPNCQIFTVKELTGGAVETCLAAKDAINNDVPLIVTNSDQTLWWDANAYLEHIKRENPDGDVVVFEGDSDKFSYIELDDEGRGVRLTEKVVISNNALVGVHYYRRGEDFVEASEELMKRNIRANNEFYVSLTYNMLIEKGKAVTSYKLPLNDDFLSIGTPEQMYEFMEKKDLNFRKYQMADMFRGWFIGDFEPAVYRTEGFEVGYLHHYKGEKWDFHYHARSTEINYLVRGRMRLNGRIVSAGDIFVFEPNMIAAPDFLEDCEVLCVKVPSVPGDKYIV